MEDVSVGKVLKPQLLCFPLGIFFPRTVWFMVCCEAAFAISMSQFHSSESSLASCLRHLEWPDGEEERTALP